jgi:hypothetical protein
MRIAIASDHAAVDLKSELREYLISQGHEVADLGPETADRVDYPDYGYKLAQVVADAIWRSALRIGHRHLYRGKPPPRPALRAGVRAAVGVARA